MYFFVLTGMFKLSHNQQVEHCSQRVLKGAYRLNPTFHVEPSRFRVMLQSVKVHRLR